MATIIKEDGSEVSGANSYISEADLATYTTDRGITLSGSPGVLILKSMDYIEVQRYIGERTTETQELEWPRKNTGIYDDDEIPEALIKAQLALCVEIDTGNDPMAGVDRETKRESVGEVSVEYMDGARTRPSMPRVDRWLSKLTLGSTGGYLGIVGVTRG